MGSRLSRGSASAAGRAVSYPRAPQEVRDNSGGVATVPIRRRDEVQLRRNPPPLRALRKPIDIKEGDMNSIIWLVGAVVIVLAILSFFGLR